MQKNYAFIDAQNIHLATQEEGWKINWRKFRIYLKDKYSVERAYIFLGYLAQNRNLYAFLRAAGYQIVFKETTFFKGRIKANVDVEMAVLSLIEINDYYQAILVSNDGDFSCLVRHLIKSDKLRSVLSTQKQKTANLLKKAAPGKIAFLSDIKKTIQQDGLGLS